MVRSKSCANVVIFSVCILCQCGLPNPFQTKPTFYITSAGNGNAVDVTIYTYQKLNPVPSVVVNGNLALTTTSGNNWYFSNFSADSVLYYKIEWSGEVLEDSVRIPPKIDSFFCNGVYLPNSYASPTMINSASSYLFIWKPVTPDTLFGINIKSSMLNFIVDQNITGSTWNFQPDTITSSQPSIIFTLDSWSGINALNQPNKSSSKMQILYDMYGPKYIGNILISK